MPKVSVIIPTYNREKYILQALDTISNQTFKDLEIIVVDDGSTDNTRETLRKYGGRIKYFYQENKGVSAARNKGIKETVGDYIAFLDSDDLWMPMHLERLLYGIQKYPQNNIVFSATELFGNAADTIEKQKSFNDSIKKCISYAFKNQGENIWFSQKNLLQALLQWGVPFRFNASLIKKAFFSTNKLYLDEDITYTEDSQFIIEAAYFTPFLYMDSYATYKIRRHSENDGDLNYGAKILESYDKRVTKLKLFFKNKKLNRQEKKSLKYLLWGLQNVVMENRSKGKNLKIRILEFLKLLYRIPCWLSIKSSIKNIFMGY